MTLQRIKKSKHYAVITRGAKNLKLVRPTLICIFSKEPLLHSMAYGYIVSKKAMKKAVDRNKFKRRIRHIMQDIEQTSIPKYQDHSFVFIARKYAKDATFLKLKNDILNIFAK